MCGHRKGPRDFLAPPSVTTGVETKLPDLTPRQIKLIALWLIVASIGSFVVAMVLSGTVLAVAG